MLVFPRGGRFTGVSWTFGNHQGETETLPKTKGLVSEKGPRGKGKTDRPKCCIFGFHVSFRGGGWGVWLLISQTFPWG